MTSRSHPIEVHFVPAGDLPLKGRIGFTLAPGRTGPGVAGMHDRDLDADLDRLRLEYGTNVLVSLVTDAEAKARTGVTSDVERRAAESRAMTFHHLPVEAGHLPAVDALVDLVRELHDHVAMGRVVVVHDRAGGGRAATVVAALLASQGHTADDAIAKIRSVRPTSIEPQQAKRLHAVSERLAERATPILSDVESAFDAQGWTYHRVPGATLIKTGFDQKGLQVPLLMLSVERHEQLLVFGRVHTTVAEHGRVAVAELLTRINWALTLGAFEMDLSDGEVRYRNAIDVEGGTLAPLMVVNLVRAATTAVAQYSPAIAAVATGRIRPAEALARPREELN
jgi:protein-tyrosine phosphatase